MRCMMLHAALCLKISIPACCLTPVRRRYGGVVFRENVARLSDWYVFSIPAITATLRASGSSPTA